MNNSHFPG